MYIHKRGGEGDREREICRKAKAEWQNSRGNFKWNTVNLPECLRAKHPTSPRSLLSSSKATCCSWPACWRETLPHRPAGSATPQRSLLGAATPSPCSGTPVLRTSMSLCCRSRWASGISHGIVYSLLTWRLFSLRERERFWGGGRGGVGGGGGRGKSWPGL